MYFHGWKHIWILFHGKPKNHLATTMQFRNILWLEIYFGQGKKLHIYNNGWRSIKVHVFAYILDYSFSLFYCMHILLVLWCIPTSFHVHCILCVSTFKQIE
jgi:hypothetical protein